MDATTFAVLSVIFVAALVRSAFGFGEALVAVPLLALVIPVEVAVPLAVLVSITVAAIVVVQDRHNVQFGSAWRLVLSTLFGIPLGLVLLAQVPEQAVKAALAIVILVFLGYCLASRRPFELKDDRLAWVFGFGAGVLGGAYGMNGPPLVVSSALRRCTTPQILGRGRSGSGRRSPPRSKTGLSSPNCPRSGPWFGSSR